MMPKSHQSPSIQSEGLISSMQTNCVVIVKMLVAQSGPTKERQNFQTDENNNKNNVSDLGDKKCKCGKEMCNSIFITGL